MGDSTLVDESAGKEIMRWLDSIDEMHVGAAGGRSWRDEEDVACAARDPVPSAGDGSHRLPPAGHEVMMHQVEGLRDMVKRTAKRIRREPTWDESRTLTHEEIGGDERVQAFLLDFGRALLAAGYSRDAALSEGGLLGHHLFYQ